MAGGPPKALPSTGPQSLRDMPHPLAGSSSEEAVGGDSTPSPDLLMARSFGDKVGRSGLGTPGAERETRMDPGPPLTLGRAHPGTPFPKDLILPNGGTPAGTSSPASSSSLLNRLQLDDDIDGETRDLFVTVDDPKKHVCTMETYITYRITTKSTRVEFDLPEYSVRRRYQDFDWLRNKLEESQPTHLIPPLPEKFVVKGVVDRFSEEFVETRRKALDKFLKRITDHPVLSFNEHFNVFLTAKDLNAYKKQGIALLTRVGESVKHVTGGYKLRSRPLEFAAIGDYLDTFALKLGTIDRIAQRIIKEEIEYLVELREYGPVYSTWSALEGELAEPLEGVSACIGNCSTALEELTDDITEEFLPVLREYILYSDSMKGVLKKRDQVHAEYEAKLEAVALRKEDRPKVPADVEKCQDRMECFNADLKADMERWQGNKRNDFRQLLVGLADKNIQYYEKEMGPILVHASSHN
ncbi:sorting nexin-30 isoform X3 [Rattus norvegicus]|uniref:sorting nexin-30 isoform X3 n=1 Tax=Rattus norvegicus TaxID=10116 RepID=UPI002FD7A3DB